jgi:hypothetical protein
MISSFGEWDRAEAGAVSAVTIGVKSPHAMVVRISRPRSNKLQISWFAPIGRAKRFLNATVHRQADAYTYELDLPDAQAVCKNKAH